MEYAYVNGDSTPYHLLNRSTWLTYCGKSGFMVVQALAWNAPRRCVECIEHAQEMSNA